MSIKTEAVSSESTSGAPLSPLVEPHSNTSTPLVDEPQMTTQRQRNVVGDDGKRNDLTLLGCLLKTSYCIISMKCICLWNESVLQSSMLQYNSYRRFVIREASYKVL